MKKSVENWKKSVEKFNKKYRGVGKNVGKLKKN